MPRRYSARKANGHATDRLGNAPEKRVAAARKNGKKGGRPPGSKNAMSQKMIAAAKASGDLPHEFLLRVMQTGRMPDWDKKGNPIMLHVGMQARLEAAARAAPFYAPKLATLRVDRPSDIQPLPALMMDLLRQGNASEVELAVLERLVGRVYGQGQSMKLLEVQPVPGDASRYEATLTGDD